MPSADSTTANPSFSVLASPENTPVKSFHVPLTYSNKRIVPLSVRPSVSPLGAPIASLVPFRESETADPLASPTDCPSIEFPRVTQV